MAPRLKEWMPEYAEFFPLWFLSSTFVQIFPLCPYLSKPFCCECYISQGHVIGIFPLRLDSFPQSAIVFAFMCAPQYFWTLGSFYIWSVQTNEYRVKKISMSCTFCSFWNVALWNRHQERRCMPGIQRPQPKLLVQESRLVNASKPLNKHQEDSSRLVSSLFTTFGEREQGTVYLDNETIAHVVLERAKGSFERMLFLLQLFQSDFNQLTLVLHQPHIHGVWGWE